LKILTLKKFTPDKKCIISEILIAQTYIKFNSWYRNTIMVTAEIYYPKNLNVGRQSQCGCGIFDRRLIKNFASIQKFAYFYKYA